MRFGPALVAMALGSVAGIASAQDDRLPVVRPRTEIVKASPSPFPFPDKQAADYDTWIRTAWVQMNRAKCGDGCMSVSVMTNAGMTSIDPASAKRGFAKLRMAVSIPASCAEYAWYGEIKDQAAVGVATKDPADAPISMSRIHLFRFDERGREVSMVFQNEHPGMPRQARLNVLCKSKS